MSRVKSPTKHKKVIKNAKGYYGRANRCYKIAKNRYEKGLLHAYVGRKLKKRDYRGLWIIRLNAAAKQLGMNYSTLISKFNKSDLNLNRKVLSNMACDNFEEFAKLVKTL